MLIKNFVALTSSLLIFVATSIAVDNNIYKNIPLCSLCSSNNNEKLLKNDQLNNEIKKMASWNQPQEDEFISIVDNEDDDSKENGSWSVETRSSYKRLKIRYKGTFDVSIKRFLLVKQIAYQFAKNPEVHLNLKRMMLYISTPSAKGITKKDFEMAYALKKIISDNKIHTVYSPGFVPRQTRLSLDTTKTLVNTSIPDWSFQLTGGRNISKTFSCTSFEHAALFVLALGNIKELLPQLKEISLIENSVKIVLQAQSQKTVHQETITVAQLLNTAFNNL